MSAVRVVDYDQEWPELFRQLRERIWPAVSDVAIEIVHVGSTSVPGLAAKPVIDLDVIVPTTAEVPTAIQRLAAVGYEHLGDLGIASREAFRRPVREPAHHLYLCPRDSVALANHLGLRDYLRARPEAAAAYGALKRDLARQFPDDIDSYIAGKTAMITSILRELGLTDDNIREIEAANRPRS